MSHWVDSLIEEKLNKFDKKFSRGTFTILEQQEIKDPQKLLGILKKFGGQGWCNYTTHVTEVKEGYQWKEEPIIAAELVNDEESLHVRSFRDGWQIRRMTSEKKGESHYLFEEAFLARHGKVLTYEIAWQKDEDGIWRAWNSRLIGIKKGK